MKQTLARLFLFVAAFTLATGQPMIPVNNISPVTSNTLIGGPATGTSGRAQVITAGPGITISGGTITASGGGGSAPSNATFITQTPNASLTAEQPLSLLASGLLWSTTGTGVITSLTMSGDGTLANTGVFTLANSGASAGTYGSATAVPVVTVDAKGRITSVSNTTITATGNVTAAGTLTSGDVVIGQGAKTLATSPVFSISGSNATVSGNLAVTGGMTLNNLTTSNLTVTTDILSSGVSDGQLYIGASGTNTFTKATLTAGPNIVIGNAPNAITISATTGGGGGAGTGLLSGGGVALAPGGGFDITVSEASYAILNTVYSSPMTDLTLSASDPTNPRIDVVAVNTSGAAVIITGTPSATPAKPDVDPSTQLELTFFLVQAASTDLDVDVTDIYLNNAEWTTTASAGTIDPASTNNPYTGAVCIEGTSVATNTYVQFVKPAAGTFDMADSDNLVFYIRSKASWANNRLMTISVRDGTNQLGNAVTFDQGLFGFNSANTTTYQQIIIPTALFAANGLSTATTIRITVGGSGGTLGFYIDDVTLQGGVASVTDASRMRWRGNYVASNFYNVNDVVLSSGIQYVAIQAGVGNTPVSAATYWQPSSSASAGTISSLTGDVTASGSGAVAATLATVNGNVGTFGSATAAPAITLNAKGLATAASNVTITPAIGSITGAGTSGNIAVSNGSVLVSVPMSGNATITSAGAVTIANSGVSAGSYTTANITVAADGRITAASNGAGGAGTVTNSGTLTLNKFIAGAGTTVISAMPDVTIATGTHNIATITSATGYAEWAQSGLGASYSGTSTSSTQYSDLLLTNNGTRFLQVAIAGSAFSGAFTPSGPTGESANIKSSGTIPLVFGSNNAFSFLLNSAQEVQVGSTSDLGAYKLQVTGNFLADSGAFGAPGGKYGLFYQQASAISNLAAGVFIASASDDHITIFPSANNGASGKKVVLGYTVGGGVWYPAFEVANTTAAAKSVGYFFKDNQGRAVFGTSSDDATNMVQVSGDIATVTIGGTLKVKSGSNSKAGTVTLASGAGTISTTAITANSVLVMSLKTASGAITAAPYATAVTVGTSYTIAAGVGDSSTYNWIILEVN